ncbi:GNAT family N-acetyltransferase [Armatimonas rosea]|uniref:Putative acetyltransferase n=1 Tax=Armatimonas rosea TaxID=685828 RepID=A0A7W9SPW0_ARMRO|nr:GNAT family N-acetyltransferase [Armatimonas rosea]MBB6050652.1 putative acetyltransferase [Armatimonas rosea]
MSELRLLTAADYLAHRQLMSHAFGRGGVVEASAEPKDPPVETLGIFVDGELASSLTTCPFTVYWPGSQVGTLAMGGIAGVASHAEARGQGHVDRLLVESLGRMRAAGQVISALYPFSFSFYGRYGWGWVGEKYGATLPLRELPASKRLARRLTGEAAQTHVTEVYAASGARYRGAFVPGSRNLAGLLSESDRRLTYAYTTEGGYLLWRYPSGEGAGEVREWMTDSPEAERALLALLRDLGVQTRQGRLTLPADTTLFCQTVLNEMDVRVEPVFMGRVVDVAAALGALKTSLPDGALTLAIDDPHADWNTGTWRVTLEGGAVHVAPTTDAAQLSLGIQAFSQAFWGTPGLERLRRAGKVGVQSEAAFTQLLALLPTAPVMCWDHF